VLFSEIFGFWLTFGEDGLKEGNRQLPAKGPIAQMPGFGLVCRQGYGVTKGFGEDLADFTKSEPEPT
jgi:hypothetical protein